MTNILELLKNEKVEWKKIQDISKRIVSGGTPNRSNTKYYGGSIPWLRTQEIDFNEIHSTELYITEDGLANSSATLIEPNTIIVAMYGATAGKVALTKIPLTTNQACCNIEVNKEVIKYRYVYYWLVNNYKVLKSMGQGSQSNINSSIIKNFPIPIPSIETQEKIVEILDTLTNSVTELQSELQLRIKQYTYFRDMLLSEEYLNKVTKEMEEDRSVSIVTLGEIGEFTRGNGLQKKDFQEEGNPVIHYGQIYTKYSFSADKILSYVSDEIFSKLRKAQKNDILIATTSENIEDVGKSVVWLGDEEIGFSGDMYSYRTKQNPKFIAYFFQTNAFQKQKERKVTGTKMIRIHSDDMKNFEIPLPSLSLQNKIVRILDKFQVMLADTEGLLPEEIKQRQKQYEYYREKLLTFETDCDSTHARTHAH